MKKNIIFNVTLLNAMLPIVAMEAQKEERLRLSLKDTVEIENPWVARYTPNCQKLIAGSTCAEFIIYDAQDPSKFTSVPVSCGAFAIDTHPDNRHIVIDSGSEQPVQFWNIESVTQIGKLPESFSGAILRSAKYNRDGSQLLVGSNKSCQLWDLKSNKKIQELAMGAQIWSTALNPADNNYVAASYGGGDLKPMENNKIALWDLRKDDQALQIIKADVPVNLVSYNDSGTQLVGTSPWQSVVYDTKTAALIAYYNLDGKKMKDKLPIPPDRAPIFADSLQFMPEGDTFVCGLCDGKLVFTDTAKDADSFCFTITEDTDVINALAISADGKRIASGLYMGDVIKIWNVGDEVRSKAMKVSNELQRKVMGDHSLNLDSNWMPALAAGF